MPIRKRFLSTADAAELIGLSKATLEKDRVTGRLRIPFIRLGRRIVYDEETLVDWVTSHASAHTSEYAERARP